MNSLEQLAECGQSVWLDYLERSLITRGRLRDLIQRDGLYADARNADEPGRRGACRASTSRASRRDWRSSSEPWKQHFNSTTLVRSEGNANRRNPSRPHEIGRAHV